MALRGAYLRLYDFVRNCSTGISHIVLLFLLESLAFGSTSISLKHFDTISITLPFSVYHNPCRRIIEAIAERPLLREEHHLSPPGRWDPNNLIFSLSQSIGSFEETSQVFAHAEVMTKRPKARSHWMSYGKYI